MPWEVDVDGKPVWVDVPQAAVTPKFTQPLVEGGAKSIASPERIAKDTGVLQEYRDYLKATSGLSDKEIDKVVMDLYNNQRDRRQFEATQGKEVSLKVQDIPWKPPVQSDGMRSQIKPMQMDTVLPPNSPTPTNEYQDRIKKKLPIILPAGPRIGPPKLDIKTLSTRRDLNPGV